jgi:Ca2+-binding EF-hand superfamily protein
VSRIINEITVLDTLDFHQFAFDMVPRVRVKLRDLRKGPLLVEFKMFDKDDNGFLTQQECMLILEMLCTANLDSQGLDEMEKLFIETFQELSKSGRLHFEGFEELVTRSRMQHERIVFARVSDIMKTEHLDTEDFRHHSEELVLLYDSFQHMGGNTGEGLEWEETRMLLIEYDLFPIDASAQNVIIHKFASIAMFEHGRMRFQKLLRLVRSLRNEYLVREEHNLKEMFTRLDKDRSATLDISEISMLLDEFGVQPHCWEDQMQIRRILDQNNEDHKTCYGFRDFCRLVQRVREYLAAATRRRQRLTATRLGFGDRQVAELREVFFTLDTLQQGFLTIDQLRKALNTLKKTMTPEELRVLVAKLDVGGDGTSLDFHKFLQFFEAVSPQDADLN